MTSHDSDHRGLAPDDSVAFPRLTPEDLTILRKYGEEKTLQDRESLWNRGDRDYCVSVILSGGCFVRDSVDAEELIAYHGINAFTGDVDVMTGRLAPVGGFADGQTSILQLSAEDVREIVRVEQDLGGKILNAFIRRRELLLQTESHGLLLIGSAFDPETQHIREFLVRNRVVHRWQRPEDQETADIIQGFGLKPSDTPIILTNKDRMLHPSIRQIADKLGIRRDTGTKLYDLVIVGAGPAGLAAAVYGASEGLSTLVLDKAAPGGQASWSSRIENYMGFPEGLTGSDLAARGLTQAQKFGAEISIPVKVIEIKPLAHTYELMVDSAKPILSRAVIVATGARYMKLDVPGFKELESSGIYYAATNMESKFCTDETIVVVGAGNSAGQACVFLSQTTKKVVLVVRGDKLNKSMSDYLSYRIEHTPNIEVRLETVVTKVNGDDRVRSVDVRGETDETIDCAGLFVFIGAIPNTEFLKGTVELDRYGFILTGDLVRGHWDEARQPFYLESSIPGIFAAGDCRVGSVKRVASSVGEGSMAVTFIHRYLSL